METSTTPTTTPTTTTTAGLRSLLLSSTQPERLADWYVAALAPEGDTNEGGYRMLSFGGFQLFVDTRDDVADVTAEPGRVILNFEVPDARAAVARIDELGARWLAPLEDRDGNLFATAVDPDGNYVQVIQLAQA